jgi:hypothetical protein
MVVCFGIREWLAATLMFGVVFSVQAQSASSINSEQAQSAVASKKKLVPREGLVHYDVQGVYAQGFDCSPDAMAVETCAGGYRTVQLISIPGGGMKATWVIQAKQQAPQRITNVDVRFEAEKPLIQGATHTVSTIQVAIDTKKSAWISFYPVRNEDGRVVGISNQELGVWMRLPQ